MCRQGSVKPGDTAVPGLCPLCFHPQWDRGGWARTRNGGCSVSDFPEPPLWLLVGATGKARDLLEVVVTRQRETVLAGIRGWCWKWGEVNGVQHICWGGTYQGLQKECVLFERERSQGWFWSVWETRTSGLVQRSGRLGGSRPHLGAVEDWGVSLEHAKLQKPIGYPRWGCCVGRWGLELGGGEELGGRYCY